MTQQPPARRAGQGRAVQLPLSHFLCPSTQTQSHTVSPEQAWLPASSGDSIWRPRGARQSCRTKQTAAEQSKAEPLIRIPLFFYPSLSETTAWASCSHFPRAAARCPARWGVCDPPPKQPSPASCPGTCRPSRARGVRGNVPAGQPAAFHPHRGGPTPCLC